MCVSLAASLAVCCFLAFFFGGFVDDGQFHHWVVISDGSGMIEAYRDNVAQTPVAIANTFNITSVGHAFNNTIHSTNGQIDELYVFDEAIGADVVNSLFTNNVVPEPSSALLVGLGGLALMRRRRSS